MDTVAVVRGERPLTPVKRDLAAWASAEYGTDVVNVTVDVTADGQPRICVWLRTTQQYRRFRTGGTGVFDPVKQAAIAARAGAVLTAARVPRSRRRRVRVMFAAFEEEARIRAADMNASEVAAVCERIGSDALWSILILYARVVFFTFTDQQREALRDGSEFHRWTTEFLTAANPRDEFGVLDTAPPVFWLDSKETFDRDFQGNSYYYFR